MKIANFYDIEKELKKDFEAYINNVLQLDALPLKYFYWNTSFFSKLGNLSFKYYGIKENDKGLINNKGKTLFSDESISFKITKKSIRIDLKITNYGKLFENINVDNQGERSDYLKEYLLWKLLESRSKSSVFPVSTTIVDIQKNNFLITYIQYLTRYYDEPPFSFVEKYKKYLRTKQGEELSFKMKNEVVHNGNENGLLAGKISRLYIHEHQENKIHFVYSFKDDRGKEEFRQLLELMGKHTEETLYRGQANALWGLDASITREPKYSSNEKDMYYDILSLKPDAFENDKTVYERLITMQHYGMPTRLLDITRNPLVAIFFACNNWGEKDQDGTIYTFTPKESKQDTLNFEDARLKSLSYLFGNETEGKEKEKAERFLSEIYFIKGVAKNQRINNQSGEFIFVGKKKEAKKELFELPKMTIVIDAPTKKILLEELDSLNIHGGSVYPDLTHMSNYIRNKYDKVKLENIDIESSSSSLKSNRKTEKEPLSSNFIDSEFKPYDFKLLENNPKEIQLSIFSGYYNLHDVEVAKIADDIKFTNKAPFRDVVAHASKGKLSVLNDRNKIDVITKDLVEFAKNYYN